MDNSVGNTDMVAIEPEILDPAGYNDGRTPWNKYDDEVKLEVIRKAIEEEKNIVDIAKEMGIDRDTVSSILTEIEQDVKINAKAQDIRLSSVVGGKLLEIVSALTKDKLNKAWPKELAMAFGILADKRRDLLGPSAGPSSLNLKVAWKDGSGAVELTTNQVQK